MDEKRFNKMTWWFLTVGTIAIASFWAIYRLFTESVPVVSSFQITETWNVELGFGISRWWDILIPLLAVTTTRLLSFIGSKQKEHSSAAFHIPWLFIVSLITGAIFGLIALSGYLKVSSSLILIFGAAPGVLIGFFLGTTIVAAGIVVGEDNPVTLRDVIIRGPRFIFDVAMVVLIPASNIALSLMLGVGFGAWVFIGLGVGMRMGINVTLGSISGIGVGLVFGAVGMFAAKKLRLSSLK